MDKALKIPDDQYRQWIADLSKRYQRSQIKAATSVNSEMLGFYWPLGRDNEDICCQRGRYKWKRAVLFI
ncbi:MAG: hypothetical protein IKE24_11730 [Clostridia bacterium]|nr:hypothetical protein [Clostridia bacterium]